jgi:hypothetical protein
MLAPCADACAEKICSAQHSGIFTVTNTESVVIRRNVKRLAPLGFSVLRNCDNGNLVVKEMHGPDICAEFETAGELDGFWNPESE